MPETEELERRLQNILINKFGKSATGGKKKSSLDGGKRKKASKKTSKKSSLIGGKSKKASKKTSKKTSKKASKKASKKTSKKTSKKISKRTSIVENDNVFKIKREMNPYMKARVELVKIISSKGKEKLGRSIKISENAKIIKELEKDIIEKYNLTDKIEILKKALDHFKNNMDKYIK
jgi:hypothetical protein